MMCGQGKEGVGKLFRTGRRGGEKKLPAVVYSAAGWAVRVTSFVMATAFCGVR